jgi:AbrB family looped-hinge helix DNA binding protein
MKSVVSEKGQVTIPKPVRERLGLKPGTVIEFEASEGRLVGRKAIVDDPFSKWRGKGRLPAKGSVDAYLRLIRDADRR